MTDLLDDIRRLKKQKNATILAHYYQEGDIQELADFTGDSLKLARAATRVSTDTLVAARAKDRKSTRLNSSHTVISYAVFCLKKKKDNQKNLISDSAKIT